MRVGVLASGGGTNLDAILAAGIPVAVVVVDRSCGATEVARAAGVPWELVQRESFGTDFDRVAYTERVVDVLQRHDVGAAAAGEHPADARDVNGQVGYAG